MRGLELNLASRPFRNNTLVWVAYVVLLAAAVGFTYWNVSAYRDYSDKLAVLDQEQGNMEQEEADLVRRHSKILRDVRQYDRPTIGRQTFKANQVIEWKAFSWTRLFNELGDVLPYGFKMTSIRPQFRDRGREVDELDPRRSMPVTVEGIARDWDAIFELETNLIEHVAFGRVNPRRTDATDNGELQFNIDFLYYPDEVEALVERARQQASGEGGEPADKVGEADDTDDGVENTPELAAAQPSTAPANDPAPRKLPAVKPETEEVTDEWAAEQAATETAQPPAQQPVQRQAPAEARREQPNPNRRNRAREPVRRTLPPAKPDPADDDEENPS